MLEYDLSNTPIFASDSAIPVPNEAELFVFTLTLLLIHGVACTEIESQTIEFKPDELERIAACVEEEVPLFTRDMGVGQALRQRLSDFVGLRIANWPTESNGECAKPG